MKLALLADVHANLEALTACLAHARAEGAERHAFVGDLVGYGADPEAVLDLVMAHAAEGAIVVRGNHDEAALGEGAERMTATAEEAIRWTQRRLPKRHRDFLASLPLTAREGELLFVHASADAPRSWIYVTDAGRARASLDAAGGAALVVSGHVHEPALYVAARGGQVAAAPFVPGDPVALPAGARALAIPGSAGQPRDGDPAACWALLDTGRRTLAFHRVDYDVDAAARKIRERGLPERLAARLERGG